MSQPQTPAADPRGVYSSRPTLDVPALAPDGRPLPVKSMCALPTRHRAPPRC
jgi:hypothetical protein